MIWNYLRMASRNLHKNKRYSLVNLAGLPIGVAGCLLIGINIYARFCRTKEIGIRKILGATVSDILALMSRNFTFPILIAIVIGLPVSILAVQQWLENFSYRIEMEWWVFLLTSLLTLLIAALTVCAQALRSEISDPVKNLKTA